MKSRSGFTIVEVTIVMAIIALLSAITIFSYSRVQTSTRDNTRKGNATIIAEALESYYAKNGEYPSVRSLVNNYAENTGEVIATKIGIKAKDLLMPRMPSGATNALTSAATPTNDYIAYIGASEINAANCQTVITGGCDEFTMRYYEESGSLVDVESRHKGRPDSAGSTPGEVAKPTLTVGQSGTDVVATATADPCETATLTAKFSFRHRINSGTWSAYSTWAASTTYSIAGTQATHYDFQAATRCDNGAIVGTSSPESDIASYDYPISPPAAPVISPALSGSNVVATITPVTCPAGTTTQYGIRSRTNDGTWSSYSAWSTTLTSSQVANQGVKYGYQARARCQQGSTNSSTATGVEATYTRPISAPTLGAISTSTSGSTTTWSWSAVSCPAGTTAEYQERDTRDGTSAYNSGWFGPFTATTSNWNTAYEGYQFTESFQARCRNSNANSPWSNTSQASYLRAITAPGGATNFTASLAGDRKAVNWMWTAPSCYAGLQAQDMSAASFSPPGNFGPFTAQGWWAPGWSQIITDGNGNPMVIAVGAKFAIQERYTCVNADTGRQSAFGPTITSFTFTAP